MATQHSLINAHKVLLPEYIKGPFGWKDFIEDGKCRREKWVKNIFDMCLVGERNGEKIDGAWEFSPWPHQNVFFPK